MKGFEPEHLIYIYISLNSLSVTICVGSVTPLLGLMLCRGRSYRKGLSSPAAFV